MKSSGDRRWAAGDLYCDITAETTLEDLNADSLDVVEVIMALESEFHMEIPDEDAEKIKTVGALAEYVQNNY